MITDNDSDYQKNCIDKYVGFAGNSNMAVFYDNDDKKRTFEIVLEVCNKDVCAELFGQDAVTFMLNNKTEAAFRLLSENKALTVPDYIKRAIEWIRQ